MNILHTILWFLVAIGVLVVVHEFGHYLAARLAGVKVLRFSVGFGKPLFSWRFGPDQTEWTLSPLPFGGYVKMLDEREGEVPAADAHRSFNRASVWRRIAIVVAGPLANFLLAIVLYWALFLHGLPAMKPLIGEPPAGTPAAHAGLAAGDEIRRINGTDTPSFQDVRLTLLRAGVAGEPLVLELADGRSVQLDAPAMQTENLDQDTLRPLGIVRYDPEIEPVIGTLLPDGAATRAGFLAGDRLLAVDGKPVANWQGWVEVIRQHPGKPLRIEYQRQGRAGALTVTPDAVEEGGQRVGKIGAGPKVDEAVFASLMTEVSYGPLDALWQGAVKTWDMSLFTLEMMGRMVVGQVSWKNLSGPLTIADYAGQSAALGWISFVGFLALVSVSLGVLNLLPIPMLDGGHLMYYVAEVLTGRPVSERTMEIGGRVGMTLLLLLMSFALFNDFQRLLGG
ncbi:MAG TPA: RIP metalloprotease RseP [Thiobacillus sp.]|nr:MAG: RIP metalloprotease RseP [Hydrogenophilales bacterium 28-61-11]OYZ55924.1 MAG: RIP metalloprotease RseP [Hydrogenophilales bacterium 16-61-112]OZA41715.1 MAG: RIP metalloprotease RseP [Hydrogenophilales bacterium 17-61-76]HQT32324.1 RIP metalloprotease RseP [Thiobacillus sp.]HQT71918.1 RIP metalloprotease RseP [Thiobacillus sp.]